MNQLRYGKWTIELLNDSAKFLSEEGIKKTYDENA